MQKGQNTFMGPNMNIYHSDLTKEQIDKLGEQYPDYDNIELARMYDVSTYHIEYLRQNMGWHKRNSKGSVKKRGKEIYMEKNGNKRYCYNLQQAADLLCTDVVAIRRACDKGTLIDGWRLIYGDID